MATRDFIETISSIDSLPDDDTPVVSPFQSLYSPALDAALDNTRLSLFVRQLHYQLEKEDFGEDRDGHHWVWFSSKEWRQQFPWSYGALRWVVNKGRALGVLVTRKTLRGPMSYRIDYQRLRALLDAQDIPLPDWFPTEIPEADPVTLGMFIEQEIEAAVEDASPVSLGDNRTCHPVTTGLVTQRQPHLSLGDKCIKETQTTAQTTVTDYEQILAKSAVEKTEHLDLSPSAPVTAPRKWVQVVETLDTLHHDDLATVQEFGDRLLECWRNFSADDAPADWADPKLGLVNRELVKIATDSIRRGNGPDYRLHPGWADRIFHEVRQGRLRDDKPIRDVAAMVNRLTREWLGRQYQNRDLTKAPPPGDRKSRRKAR